ncbi:hypothetical protein Pmani_016339 [Petrolisthes manimaculis]|uniref:Ion transport domain-containing protein n=1 Tax=Petrolisthes manimaculis TaxID=1843537 RepID=A0AAE1PSH5_9EUCA|nr:hypothetical protein Pmani_016339 [Petrolisthes manimaculis]
MTRYLELKPMEGNGCTMQGSGGTTTVGGPDDDEYRQEMLVAVQTGDEERLKESLSHLSPSAINTVFPDCDGEAALHIAVKYSSLTLVILLLEAGAQANVKSVKGKKCTPIHFAATNGNPQILRALLNKGADPNSKEEVMGRCPLHLLANSWKKDEENNYTECLDALLSSNKIRIDMPDTKQATPLFFAATKNWEFMAKRLIEKGASLTTKVGRKTTEDIVKSKFHGLLESIDFSVIEKPKRHFGDELYGALVNRDINQFRNVMNELNDCGNKNMKQTALEETRGNYTMLQYACEHGLPEFVEELAKSGASASQKVLESEMSALLYAARNGHYRILEFLLLALKDGKELDKGLKQRDRKQETVLHKVVKREYGVDEKDGVDFYRCLQLLLDEKYKKFINIDAQDAFGNTPLHYAVLCDDQSFVRLLLLNGSHLGIRNKFGTLAITRIQANVLEEVLNDSIKHNNNLTDKDFEIILHYSLLAPTHTPWRPETECLSFLSRSSKHRRLLLHPIFDTFLSLKWQRIQQYYFFNIVAYTLFLIFLTIYILMFHGSFVPVEGKDTENVNTTISSLTTTTDGKLAGKIILQVLITLFLLYITIREGIQLFVSWKLYIFKLENWLEISIVVLTIVLLFVPVGESSQQSLSAWLILFSWIEFILLLGRHPYLAIYITMFTTVAFNFLKFIIMFSFMIIAFSISFYLVFQVDENFSTYSGALLKTLAMATGEMEYTDLPLSTYPVSSHLLFIMFMFSIVLVLMNLLNGLAVSDIQQLREEAKLVSYISRVELISYIESVFLGSPLEYVLPGPLKCCEGVKESDDSETTCSSSHNPFMKLLDWLGRRILMFHSCLNRTEPSIKLYPNREFGRWKVCECHKFSLKESQIEAAKDIVLEKAHAVSHHRFSGIENRMDEIMTALTTLTETVNNHVLCPSPQ